MALPPFKRDEYVTTHEVEIAHLEDQIHVTPGEVLVPLPDLEKNVKRRTFFMNFTHVIGFLIGLPLAYPILRFLMKPMYAQFDNGWLKIGNVGKIKQDDVGDPVQVQEKGQRSVYAGGGVEKNVWILKATPAVLEKVYQGKDMEFRDAKGKAIWTNKKDVPYVAFSGKCPHLRLRIQVAAAQGAGTSVSLPVPFEHLRCVWESTRRARRPAHLMHYRSKCRRAGRSKSSTWSSRRDEIANPDRLNGHSHFIPSQHTTDRHRKSHRVH